LLLTWGCIPVILIIFALRLLWASITIPRDSFTWRTWWIICVHACSSRCPVCFQWTFFFHPIIKTLWTSCSRYTLSSKSNIHCVPYFTEQTVPFFPSCSYETLVCLCYKCTFVDSHLTEWKKCRFNKINYSSFVCARVCMDFILLYCETISILWHSQKQF